MVINLNNEILASSSRVIKGGIYILIGGLMVGGCFFFFAPMDKTVSGSGFVIVESEKQILQSPVSGKVERILTRDGQVVRVGDPLVEFDTREMQVELIAAKSEYQMTLDILKRLGGISGNIQTASQRSYASALTHAREAEVAAMEERLAGIRADRRGTELQLEAQKRQQEIMAQQHDALIPLVEQGMYATTRLLDLKRAQANLEAEVSRLDAATQTLRSTELTTKVQIRQRKAEAARDDARERVDAERKLIALQGSISRLEISIEQSLLKAPVSGEVVGLSIHTIGAVVSPGQRLLEIVPKDQRMMVEAKFPASLGDKLRSGQRAQIHFQSTDIASLPDVFGVVETVSADALTDERTGAQFLSAKLNLEPSAVRELTRDGSPLRPGFPVEAVVTTGQRTAAEYLLGPLRVRIKHALTQ